MAKYQIFEGENRKTGTKTITVISRFAGKTVRGVAKCNPNTDVYDYEKGVALAKARCDERIAEKRARNAKAKFTLATRNTAEADAYERKMKSYFEDATIAFVTATQNRVRLEEELKG